MNILLSPCVPENLVSRDGFSRPVPRQPAHLHTQAESGAYLRDSSRVPRRRLFMKPPYAIGSVPSLSGHAIAYRWRLLPRVRRHRASKHQGSSERVLPWQFTMDQFIFASLSHTHHWYEVGMLKVPACIYIFNSTLCDLPPVWPQLVRPNKPDIQNKWEDNTTHTTLHCLALGTASRYNAIILAAYGTTTFRCSVVLSKQSDAATAVGNEATALLGSRNV